MRYSMGLLFTVVAMGFFIPGIILPMFTLTMEMSANVSGALFNSELINKELSIITTIEELWRDKRYIVSLLILIFSILIPLSKAALLITSHFVSDASRKQLIVRMVSAIGKWSMADVFVVAIFIAVLSTSHAQTASTQEISFFGMQIGFNISTQTLSNVGEGFYYFTGYCLLSLLGSTLMCIGNKGTTNSASKKSGRDIE